MNPTAQPIPLGQLNIDDIGRRITVETANGVVITDRVTSVMHGGPANANAETGPRVWVQFENVSPTKPPQMFGLIGFSLEASGSYYLAAEPEPYDDAKAAR